MNDNTLAQTLDEQGEHDLAGCVRCGQWDRDEDGRLMCVCDAKRYAEFHQPKESGTS